jgi:hypothetical protein
MSGSGDLPALAEARRVLLVEFVDLDRFPGQIDHVFPFLQGYCRGRGADVRWIRFGVATTNFFAHGVDAVTLTDAELLRLGEAADALRPDLVVVTHELRAQHAAALRVRHPGARLVLAADLVASELGSAEPTRFRAHAELDREGFAPDYRWEPGNAGATRRDRHNVYVALRSSCGYRRAVTANPCYAGVELATTTRTVGCAFCGRTWGHVAATAEGPTPREWIAIQLRAIRAAYGDHDAPNALLFEDLEGEHVLRHVVEAAAELGLRDVKLLFALRVDRLLDLERAIRRALPDLARAGNAIHVHVMGLESFSDAELQRFNKGFAGLQALRAVNLIQDLEVEHPESFHYSGYRPLAMILFTPWTTPEDLDLNLGLMQHLGIEDEVGNVFVARLRLHEDLAITALARHDGLVVDAVGDEALLLNRRKLFAREVPWRFRDARLESVNSLATRLEGLAGFAGDQLAGMLGELKARHAPPGGWDQGACVGLLRAMVDEARAVDEPLPAEELLPRAFQRWLARATEGAGAGGRTRFDLAGRATDGPEFLSRLLPLLDGAKPVISLERVPPRLASGRAAEILERGGVHVEHLRVGSPGEEGTLLLSRDAALLARAATLEADLRAGADGALARAARAELAALYGYPECCARAWADGAWARVGLERWALAALRSETPGPISPWCQPFAVPDLAFVPCSCGCERAAARYREWLELLGGEALASSQEEWVWLAPLDGIGAPVAIRPTARDERGLRYEAGGVRGHGPLRDSVARGTRLEVAAAQVRIGDGARTLTSWTASLLHWDTRAAPAAAHWAEVARAALRRADPAARAARARARDLSRSMAADPVTRRTPESVAAGGAAPVSCAAEILPVDDWSEVTLTARCNQRCFFCYEEARHNAADPPLDRVKELLRETRRHAERVVLCGREVLLRRDVLEIVAFARSIGLSPVVFTNGQLLATPGLVERLAAAGCVALATSFHFPDGASFARGARVSPSCYERVVDGLRRVRDHNLGHPDRELPISIEIDMFALNAGRLAEMRATLCDALRGAPWRLRLASLLPTRVEEIGLPHVLDPIDDRRREVAEFVRSQPDDVPLGFVKVPLCLLPEGDEHRSLDVQYVHDGTRLTFNHDEGARITLDTFSPSAAREVDRALRRQPYRWLCRGCALVAMCRFERLDWAERGFEPTREQRPTPYHPAGRRPLAEERAGLPGRVGAADEVLARLGPSGDAVARVAAVAQTLGRNAYPEEAILADLAGAPAGAPALVEVWAEGTPLLVVELAHEGARVGLRLGAPVAPGVGRRLGPLIDYLEVQPVAGASATPEHLLACLRHLARLELPPLQRWADDPWFDVRVAASSRWGWRRFGERLWPQLGAFGGWETAESWLDPSLALAFRLEHPTAGRARLAWRLADDAAGSAGATEPTVDLVVSFTDVGRAAGDGEALLHLVGALATGDDVPVPRLAARSGGGARGWARLAQGRWVVGGAAASGRRPPRGPGSPGPSMGR